MRPHDCESTFGTKRDVCFRILENVLENLHRSDQEKKSATWKNSPDRKTSSHHANLCLRVHTLQPGEFRRRCLRTILTGYRRKFIYTINTSRIKLSDFAIRIRMKLRFEDSSSFSKFWLCFLQSFQSHHRCPRIPDFDLRQRSASHHLFHKIMQRFLQTAKIISKNHKIYHFRKPQIYLKIPPEANFRSARNNASHHSCGNASIWLRALSL